jgi:hypothetical protein
MSVTRVDWWLGVAVVVVLFMADGCWPRYEWHALQGNWYARFDRWTGNAVAYTYERRPPIPIDQIAEVVQPASRRYVYVLSGWPPIDLAMLAVVVAAGALVIVSRRRRRRSSRTHAQSG